MKDETKKEGVAKAAPSKEAKEVVVVSSPVQAVVSSTSDQVVVSATTSTPATVTMITAPSVPPAPPVVEEPKVEEPKVEEPKVQAPAPAAPLEESEAQTIVNPMVIAEWVVRKTFIHKGVRIAPGEPLPDLDEDEALRLMASGAIRHASDVGKDASVRPRALKDYLIGPDQMVLRRLRQFPLYRQPDKEDLYAQAKRGRRSHTLVEALALHAGVPLAR
jgi:hypothetical protein